MKTNAAGINLIKRFETFQPNAYRCPAGVLTIGYGHTGDVREGARITEHQADAILDVDLDRFERGVAEQFAAVNLNENQFSALVSFAFNVGLGGGPPGSRPGLAESSLRKHLLAGRVAFAADEFRKWVHAGGVKLNGLVKRREAERALFLESVQ